MAKRGTLFMMCDLQKVFAPRIYQWGEVVKTADTLMGTARILGIPSIVTEQYPRGLGHTVEELQQHIVSDPATIDPASFNHLDESAVGNPDAASLEDGQGAALFEKTQFSMWTPEVQKFAAESLHEHGGLKRAVLFGIEGHVCVMQTCLDLLAQGVEVHLVTDGVSSQRPGDRALALQRMRAAGAVLTSTEALMLELLGDASHPKFKPVQKLLVKHIDEAGWDLLGVDK